MSKSEYILPVFLLPLCLARGIALAADTGKLPDTAHAFSGVTIRF